MALALEVGNASPDGVSTEMSSLVCFLRFLGLGAGVVESCRVESEVEPGVVVSGGDLGTENPILACLPSLPGMPLRVLIEMEAVVDGLLSVSTKSRLVELAVAAVEVDAVEVTVVEVTVVEVTVVEATVVEVAAVE